MRTASGVFIHRFRGRGRGGPGVAPMHRQTNNGDVVSFLGSELSYCSCRYGALSSESGKLKLSWTLNDGRLGLDWSESGGPVTKPPSAKGFGTRIITASIERQLFGHVAFDWRPDGLRCMISVPLCNTMGATELSELRGDVDPATVGARIALAGDSIMLVEDEAIVALALNDSLTDMGFSVVGPFSRISDACRALQDNQVDGAILDVNLAGETVYSLAEILTARKIPFVFATGYGAESIEPRFEHIPVLQKPIEKEMLTRVFVRSDTAQSPPCTRVGASAPEHGEWRRRSECPLWVNSRHAIFRSPA